MKRYIKDNTEVQLLKRVPTGEDSYGDTVYDYVGETKKGLFYVGVMTDDYNIANSVDNSSAVLMLTPENYLEDITLVEVMGVMWKVDSVVKQMVPFGFSHVLPRYVFNLSRTEKVDA